MTSFKSVTSKMLFITGNSWLSLSSS